MADLPIVLVESIEREPQTCILFCGPRLALPPVDRLGPPGPETLAGELLYRLGHPLDDYTLLWIAQSYADKFGYEALRQYVAERLDNTRYRPTLAQHLIAQLPFQTVVATGQDSLLRQAYQAHRVPVDYAFSGQPARRKLIHLYGISEQPATLRLTEDERRQIFYDHSELADFLRVQANLCSLLFLGYTHNEAALRDLYKELRPQINQNAPRAYCVQAEPDNDEELSYWRARNLSTLRIEEVAFLQQLAETLARRGKIPILLTPEYEQPPVLSPEDRRQQEDILLELSRQLGFAIPAENRTQLLPRANSLSFIRSVLAEDQRSNLAKGSEGSAQPSSDESDSAAQIRFQLGNAEWADGNREPAREFFEDAIRHNPNLIEAYFSLYYLLIEMDKIDAAAGIYRQLLVKAPNQALLPERYQFLAILGRNNVGIAYKVYDTERAAPVIVTILRRALTRRPEIVEEFQREISRVDSQRISHLLGTDRYRGRSYLVTAYVEGQTLRHRLEVGTPLSLREIFQICDDIGKALEDAHQQGVPYLDLHPANIILSPEGVKLVNYGFSLLLRRADSKKGAQDEGKTEYQSPEQRAGKPGDTRSDIYAFGTILYEMLAGRLPGVGAFEEASQIRAEVDEAIDVVIAHARSLDPARRFRSIAEMRKEIQRISPVSRPGTMGQYLRLCLTWVSNLYVYLASLKGNLWLAVLLLVVAGIETRAELAALRGISRGILILIVNSLITSVLGYYIMREFARVEGLGSLISTGRGAGATLGWLLGFWILRATAWPQGTSIQNANVRFAIELVPIVLMIALLFTVLTLLLIRALARLAERLRYRYTLGFYGGFVAVCVLSVGAAWLRLGYGIIRY